MLTDTTRSPYAKVHALDGMKVKWTGGLWKERFDTCANSTVPQLKHMFDSKDISHVVENFKICAGDAGIASYYNFITLYSCCFTYQRCIS